MVPETIIKRDGRLVPFDASKIQAALEKCFASIGQQPGTRLKELTASVVNAVGARLDIPTVEQVQDVVERVLQGAGEFKAARHYILYREEHSKLRETRPVPDEVRAAFESSAGYFPTALQQFQFYDKYSRFDWDLGRRETWEEAVGRAVAYLANLSGCALGADTYEEIRQAILKLEVAPSMRLLAMAGPAADRQHACLYNCAFLPIRSVTDYREMLILAMNGVGVGFSVERANVEHLPEVRESNGETLRHTVEDSVEGWADALELALIGAFEGYQTIFDYSQVRPAGAPLRTKGGRASGPEPLKTMIEYAKGVIRGRVGARLRPIDAHDIACAVGAGVVAGAMRRTAMISLFDRDDWEMLNCKSNPGGKHFRWMANNSAVWTGPLSQQEIAAQMLAMAQAGNGEPGIFSRYSANQTGRYFGGNGAGVNPCGEVLLPEYGFCNLSSIIARPGDTYESLARKARLATIIGTIQATATHFPGLRPMWRENCERERLLGVSLGGQFDSRAALDYHFKSRLFTSVVQPTNRETAALLGINPAAALTCVKPDGNLSTLADMSPGMHPRHSPFYLRRVRVNKHTPMYRVLADAGLPLPDDPYATDTAVASFPVKAPSGTTKNGVSALDMLDLWIENKLFWTDHNPSATIHYRPDELIGVMEWVWENQGGIGGLSFLPLSTDAYELMPYEAISEQEYNQAVAAFPAIDFSKIYRYEESDLTTAAQELACVAGACDWR